MELSEMIKVMQHYEDGGDIEVYKNDRWTIGVNPIWDWDTFDYRIKEQKQKVTIEKWILYDKYADVYFECRTSNIDKMLQDTPRITKKVKLLESYEVEL